MFLYKSLFFSISSVISIPTMLIGINGGYFPAICRVCFFDLLSNEFGSNYIILAGTLCEFLYYNFLVVSVFSFRLSMSFRQPELEKGKIGRLQVDAQCS